MEQDELNNPYAAPSANVDGPGDADGQAKAVALYSPGQVGIGVFLGGPAGFIYFLHSNFRHLGDSRRALNVVFGGLALFVLLLGLGYLGPKWIGYSFSLALIILARNLAKQYHTPEMADIPHYRQSGWKVFGLGIACSVLSILVFVVPAVVYAFITTG